MTSHKGIQLGHNCFSIAINQTQCYAVTVATCLLGGCTLTPWTVFITRSLCSKKYDFQESGGLKLCMGWRCSCSRGPKMEFLVVARWQFIIDPLTWWWCVLHPVYSLLGGATCSFEVAVVAVNGDSHQMHDFMILCLFVCIILFFEKWKGLYDKAKRTTCTGSEKQLAY